MYIPAPQGRQNLKLCRRFAACLVPEIDPRAGALGYRSCAASRRWATVRFQNFTNHKRHSAATPQPMAMTLPFGRNLNASYSPPRRGGVDAPSKKCREATKAARTPLLCEEGNVRAEKLCPKN